MSDFKRRTHSFCYLLLLKSLARLLPTATAINIQTRFKIRGFGQFCEIMTDTSEDTSKVQWPRIFLFGDSLTQHAFLEDGCWGALLAASFERKCDIVSRGFSGYNTRMCKYVLPRLFDKDDVPSTVAFVLWLGANDAAPAQDLGRQHVPLSEYVDNLDEMLQYLKGCGLKSKSIILLTPPPFDEEKWAQKCREKGRPESRRESQVLAMYTDACVCLGGRHNVTVVNLYSEMLREKDWKDMLCDGLHLAKSGGAKVASLLLPHLQRLTANAPTLFPDWKEIDRDHPEKSLLNWKPH
ncbi:isoamyl acetate-hydrolyzing esterase 1 homolog [Ornithodoros turicata]|uniref:isoamyl acetate-hydrolyzing esterase 1 homolog n=1 Tax=Ornithodoros turicata TaxID=34597 RepID=UPI0031397227